MFAGRNDGVEARLPIGKAGFDLDRSSYVLGLFSFDSISTAVENVKI